MANHNYLITPSLLSADFARLGEESASVLQAGADGLHLDVMDNHYVPNLTIGPIVCESLRKFGIKAPIDVHLMVKPVDRLVMDFAKAGASSITFHPDATEDIEKSINLIHQQGCKTGLALNPDVELDPFKTLLDKLDIILIMSVNPGFGGQAFIPSTLEKVKYTRECIKRHSKKIRLGIDGGIKINNIYSVAEAGADTFISGSGIFLQKNYADILQKMREELKRVKL